MERGKFLRQDDSFSKKIDNFKAAIGLHYGYYNLVRGHGTIRMTPALKAGCRRVCIHWPLPSRQVCYTWSDDRSHDDERYFAVLGTPPINSAKEAVRAMILSEFKNRRT